MGLIGKLPALLLIIFGLIGVMGAGAGYYFLENHIPLISSIEDKSGLKDTVEDVFQSMSVTMEDASLAAKNAGVSIRSATEGLDNAVDTTGDLKENMLNSKTSLNNAAGFIEESGNIFYSFNNNTLMLVGDKFSLVAGSIKDTSNYFDVAATKFDEFGTNLKMTSTSLESNAGDMDKLSEDLQMMGDKLEAVSYKFVSLTNIDIGPFIYWGVVGGKVVLVYFGLLHLMFLIIGVYLLKQKEIKKYPDPKKFLN
jgi:hypothetical protein